MNESDNETSYGLRGVQVIRMKDAYTTVYGPYTPAMVQASVRRGVAWLDAHHPGWLRDIDLSQLDLCYGQTSPALLGLSFVPKSPYTKVLRRYASGESVSDYERWSAYHGFTIRHPASALSGRTIARFEMLQTEWVQAIRARLAEIGDKS